MSLEGRIAAVTGGSRGIGQAIVEKLVGEGAKVAILDRQQEWDDELKHLAAEGKIVFHLMDVVDRASIEAAFAAVQDELGDLSILVNNAGISMPGPLEELPLEKWDAVMNVNLRGVLCCSQVAFPSVKKNGGAIVNISSMSGIEPYAGMGAYSASKAGVVILTQQMAYEWAPYKIRVNAICPGLIRSPLTEPLYQDPEILAARVEMVPAKRIGTPADVAAVAAFLLSDEASYVTGQAIIVDGGLLGSIQARLRGRSAS